MPVSARMVCDKTEPNKPDDPDYLVIRLRAVYDEDPASPNYSFSQATPNGEVHLVISNKAAFSAFEIGKEYDILFTKTGDAASASSGGQGDDDGITDDPLKPGFTPENVPRVPYPTDSNLGEGESPVGSEHGERVSANPNPEAEHMEYGRPAEDIYSPPHPEADFNRGNPETVPHDPAHDPEGEAPFTPKEPEA
jgi:hypothetical protein